MANEAYDRITLDEEYQPLLLSMGQYKLFMAHGAPGRDAMAVFLHLMFTARLQQTNQVRATQRYIQQGLGMGEKRVKAAKSLLSKLGMIEYHRNRDGQHGTLGEVYIRVRYMPTQEATAKAVEATGAATAPVDSPQGSFTTPVVIHTCGSEAQMLEVNKGNASSEEEEMLEVNKVTASGEEGARGDTASESPTPSDPKTEDTEQSKTQASDKGNTVSRPTHPSSKKKTLEVDGEKLPVGETRYLSLVKKRGEALVEWAIRRRRNWEEANGKKPAKDYAAAAANWIEKAEQIGDIPEHLKPRHRSGPGWDQDPEVANEIAAMVRRNYEAKPVEDLVSSIKRGA